MLVWNKIKSCFEVKKESQKRKSFSKYEDKSFDKIIWFFNGILFFLFIITIINIINAI